MMKTLRADKEAALALHTGMQFVPRPTLAEAKTPWLHFEAPLKRALASNDRHLLNALLNDGGLAPLSALAGFTTAAADKPYTRNLLVLNERFALMALVWRPGAVSSIHAHAGSGCWFRVLSGSLEEIVYTVSPRKDAIAVSHIHSITDGESSYVDDDLGVHAMRNPGDGACVSLHFYAPPFKSCDVYLPASDGSVVVKNKSISFDMEFGKLVE